MKKENKTKTLPVRFSKDEYELLRIESFERNISMGSLIRQSVAYFIKNFNAPEEVLSE